MSRLSLTITTETNLLQYWKEVQRFAFLSHKEEYDLAQNYQQNGDLKAAHKLVTSHLRYVVKIAFGYRAYGLPLNEIISEGNIGLMQAVKKFNPERGFRLATYAICWIKAAIQEYILRSWSLVRIGTTINQRKLFFNLKKLKDKIQHYEDRPLTVTQTKTIATMLNVSEKEVESMSQRLLGDNSLHAPAFDNAPIIDLIESPTDNQETLLIEKDEKNFQLSLLNQALSGLNEREQAIFKGRRLIDPPQTLETLANQFNVSRERIRQIEEAAFKKVKIKIKEELAADMVSPPQLN